MNNSDFRRMVATDSSRPPRDDASTASSRGPSMRLGMPMTPRTVKGSSVNFAQQLAAQNSVSRPQKKFRSSAAPKGSKLAAGYHDRTQDRAAADSDDKASRVKALEEQMKLGQIDADTFNTLRDQITGGEASATHLVKGLDWKLLERVRKGEDVLQLESEATNANDENPATSPGDDAEFEELEKIEVKPIERAHVTKKGEMAPPPPIAGVKRSRNEILAELKASRQAAQEAAQQSQLGSRFRKLGDKKASSRIEIDAKGRQVLITIDEQGNVKRKVRKDVHSTNNASAGLLVPDQNAAPLGMAVPENLSKAIPDVDEDEDDDIFAGVGADYDPLGAQDDDSDRGSGSNSDSDSHASDNAPSKPSTTITKPTLTSDTTTQPSTTTAQPRRNYFTDTPSQTDASNTTEATNEAAIRAAIKHAASLKQAQTANQPRRSGSRSPSPHSSAAQRLFARDRDLDDMDLGFGSSRFEDDEDVADDGPKLSQWKGLGAEDEEGDGDGKGRGGKARKRGKKKRKGDKESAVDVLRVIEGRKKLG